MKGYHDGEKTKPLVHSSGIFKGQSEPVEAIDIYGRLCHVIWDGKEWHEFNGDGSEETFGRGIRYWRHVPVDWMYDSDFYSIGENRCQKE